MALLAQRHRDWGYFFFLPPPKSKVDFGVRAGHIRQPCSKKQTAADSSQPDGASLEGCCSASSAHGNARTEAQRLGLLASLPTTKFKGSLEWGGPCRAPSQLAPKMRTSADSSQPEETNMESCCSAPSAHGNARTEAQRLGLLPCLPTTKFKGSLEWGGSVPGASVS